MSKYKKIYYIVSLIWVIGFIVLVLSVAKPVEASDNGLILVDSTAYYDSHGYGYGATGQPLVEGLPTPLFGNKLDIFHVYS